MESLLALSSCTLDGFFFPFILLLFPTAELLYDPFPCSHSPLANLGGYSSNLRLFFRFHAVDLGCFLGPELLNLRRNFTDDLIFLILESLPNSATFSAEFPVEDVELLQNIVIVFVRSPRMLTRQHNDVNGSTPPPGENKKRTSTAV